MAEELGLLAEGLGEVAEHVAVVDNRGGIEHGGVADGAGADVAEDDLAQLILGVAEIGERLEGSVLNRSVCSASIASSGCSARGSSTCSIVWNGNTTLQTVLVLPFQTSSTWRLSSNNRAHHLLAFLVAEARHLVRWERRVVYGA